jgi:hypothetical protein
MSIKASLLLAFLTFTGCATVTADVMNQPPRPMYKRTADQVELFTAGVPSRPRVDVAVLRFGGVFGDGADPTTAMRQEAANMGCDGLVLAHLDTGLAGTCIVYTDTPAAAAPAPAAPATAPAPTAASTAAP